MRQQTTQITCDICDRQINIIEAAKCHKTITVIQTTEQTEGRSTDPYLSNQNLDICYECESRILKGNMLFSSGAQGYNTYTIKE